jgi:hypothetical protein
VIGAGIVVPAKGAIIESWSGSVKLYRRIRLLNVFVGGTFFLVWWFGERISRLFCAHIR